MDPQILIKQSPIELIDDNHKALITSGYGFRIVDKERKFHHGLDLVRYDGKLKTVARIVNPFEKAIVLFAKSIGNAGKTVILMDLPSAKRDYRVFGIFCHLNKWYDNPSSVLDKGEPFAMMGNTGRSYGAHLHFGIAVVDDKDFTDLGALPSGTYSVNPKLWSVEGAYYKP